MSAPRLELRGVGLRWPGRRGRPGAQVLSDIDLALAPGEALGLVGESGSGKTTLGRVATALLRPDRGEVRLDGAPFAAPMPLPRRAAVQAVFQDTLGALNPRLSLARQMAEPLLIHGLAGREARRARVAAAMAEVDLDPALLAKFPGELSGGQRQRALIARALALEPSVLVCDEPVSALDVSVQARVLDLLGRLRRERGLTLLFISHDLRVVRRLCDRTAVLYRGRIMEIGPSAEVLERPAHPYAAALAASLPRDHPADPPRPSARPADPALGAEGCPFAPRCPRARPDCAAAPPPLRPLPAGAGGDAGDAGDGGTGRRAACLRPAEAAA